MVSSRGLKPEKRIKEWPAITRLFIILMRRRIEDLQNTWKFNIFGIRFGTISVFLKAQSYVSNFVTTRFVQITQLRLSISSLVGACVWEREEETIIRTKNSPPADEHFAAMARVRWFQRGAANWQPTENIKRPSPGYEERFNCGILVLHH